MSAIAGGGGLIILPALLAAGLPPLNALATTKLQGLFGISTSTISYARHGYIQFSRLKSGMILAGVFAAIGVFLVQKIETHILEQALPILLLVVCIYMLKPGSKTHLQREAKLTDPQFNVLVGSSSGFYVGIFGPAIGSFLIAAFSGLRGDEMRSAVSNSKALLLAGNGVATISFILAGHTVWALGLSMAAIQVLGARLGAKMTITKGAKIIKPAYLVITLLTAIQLLLKG